MSKWYNDRREWVTKLSTKYPKPDACNGCPLHASGAGFARTDGTGRNGVLLVGEALGETEAEQGKPFKGEAGMMLNRILHRVGMKRDDFLIANTINCNPPNNVLTGAPYEAAAISHCSPYLHETILASKQIKVLVPMGNTATQRLLPGAAGVYSFHGTVHWHPLYKMWVVPTFHPSYMLQSGCKEVLTVISDLNKAFEVLKNEYTDPIVDFIEYPTAVTATAFATEYEMALVADPDTMLSVDIETPYSHDIDEEDKDGKDSSWIIERISFAFKKGHAITMPYIEPFIGIVGRLLSSRGTKLFWNGNKFDVPRLRSSGHWIGGQIIDGMDAFHFLYSDIPRGLGYATPFFTDYKPWKHLAATNMPFYSCMDAVAALENVQGIRQRLKKDKLWDVFIRDFVNLEPTFSAMSQVGIGIDTAKQEELRVHYETIRDHSTEVIQALVPQEVRPVVKKGGYKGSPKDVRELVKQGTPIDRAWVDCGYFQQSDGRWNKRGEFNPSSPVQIKQYIEWKYGKDAIPHNKKTGRETTGNEEIERVAKRYNDKVLFTIIDSSSAGDKLSSFINNWPIASDGRVHPTFTNNPATFRLSSVRPNSQNFPHRSEELDKMREMIIAGAEPGDDWWIVEADYSGIEAIEVGHYAHDSDYVRLAMLGVHSFLASNILGRPIDLSLDTRSLKMAIGEAKRLSKKTLAAGTATAVYDVAKRVIHGSNYGMGKKLMHDSYPEAFPTQADAGKLQDMYFSLFPKVKKWQERVVDIAYEQCCLVNDFGYRRWFWDAKRWAFNQRTNGWELVPSGDAKKIISTLPQGSAAAIIRGAMLSPSFQSLVNEQLAMIQIHDSLVCRARTREVEDVVERLTKAMTYPIIEQSGLVIPVEVKVGRNWRSYDKDDNPRGMKEFDLKLATVV